MKNLSDEKFEQLLTDYCEAQPEQSFVYDPDREGEKIIPFVRYRKQLVAAASLVLVSVLSLTVYFLLGNKISTPIAVAPSPQSATTPSAPTGESDSAIPEDQQENIEATEAPSVLQQIINSIFTKPSETRSNGTSPTAVSPTEKGKSSGRTQPSETTKTSETQSATQKSSSSPTQPISQPTQPAPQPTQAPVRPTEPPKPTVPADPPWIEPSEGGSNPDPWGPEAPVPTEGEHDGEPGDPYPGFDLPTFDLFARFATSRLTDSSDEYCYCKVYDNTGKLLGDSNLYSAEHIADIVQKSSDMSRAVYITPEGLIWRNGYYNYVFYDKYGRMLAQGQEYLDI